MSITLRAHAKINWSLNVLARRDDGYHELDMLMQTLELCDELTFERARWLSLSVDGCALPVGGRNLVLRAAQALNEYMGQRNGARILLRKRIPVRAGLGGGSADCAAALIGLNRLWNLRLSMDALMDIGGRLGSDVPFCLRGGLARVRGTGEKITALDGAPSVPLALVTPGDGLSTAGVFRRWDEDGQTVPDADFDALAAAIADRDWPRAQALSCNALEPPARALLPAVGDAMDAFRALGARMVRMTGSGSTVFAVFDSDAQAQAAAARIPGAIATRTLGGDGKAAQKECANGPFPYGSIRRPNRSVALIDPTRKDARVRAMVIKRSSPEFACDWRG